MRLRGLFFRDAACLPSTAAAFAKESQATANSSKVSVEAMLEDHSWTKADVWSAFGSGLNGMSSFGKSAEEVEGAEGSTGGILWTSVGTERGRRGDGEAVGESGRLEGAMMEDDSSRTSNVEISSGMEGLLTVGRVKEDSSISGIVVLGQFGEEGMSGLVEEDSKKSAAAALVGYIVGLFAAVD